MLEAQLLRHNNCTLSGINGICQLQCGTVQTRPPVWGFGPVTPAGQQWGWRSLLSVLGSHQRRGQVIVQLRLVYSKWRLMLQGTLSKSLPGINSWRDLFGAL